MPKPTGLSPDAEAQEAADAAVGKEINRDEPKPKPKAPAPKPKKMASGGSVRGKGCETKGTGKGRFV